MIALEDLKEQTEQDIKENLIENYSDQTPEKKREAFLLLIDKIILIAYESTGSWDAILQHTTY